MSVLLHQPIYSSQAQHISGLPAVDPPSAAVLEAVVGQIVAEPPVLDPTEQHKKKFRLRLKQKAADPGY